MRWEELVAKLSTPVRTSETMAEYRRMSKDEQSQRKDQGGFVGGATVRGQRKKGEITERYLITLDADNARSDDWEQFTTLYDDIACCVYSTHSHTSSAPRLRWVFPLSRPVSPDEYEAISRRVAEWIGINTFDCTTYQPERLMYWPSVCLDGEFFFRSQEGDALDADEVLRTYGDEPEAWKNTGLWPIGKDEEEIIRRERKMAGDPTEKEGLIGIFCRLYDIYRVIDELIPGTYDHCYDDRYTYTEGTTSAGAIVYGQGKWLYSNHSTDPCCDQLCNSFDLVRIHKFGHLDMKRDGTIDNGGGDATKLKSYKSMMAYVAELPEVKAEIVAQTIDDYADMSGAEDGMSDAESDGTSGASADLSWTEELSVDKSGAVQPTLPNCQLILEHDPRICGRIKYDEFKNAIKVYADLPWKKLTAEQKIKGELWTDSDSAQMRAWFARVYGIQAKDNIKDAVTVVADNHKFHPVRDYLMGLKWDGVERLDTHIIKWFDADDTELNRAITRKWYCAGVARVMHPGCQFDNMLVLVGRQGIGKSRYIKTMSKGWFTDSIKDVETKDAKQQLFGCWLVEMAEMAGMKRSDVNAVKAFLSAPVDNIRVAYGQFNRDYPRQCIFYGSSNDLEILKDQTGKHDIDRRFWPIKVRGVGIGEMPGLEDEVDQVWAEAVVRWKAGEKLYINTNDLRAALLEQQEEFKMGDDLEEMIQQYLDTEIPLDWDDRDIDERRRWYQGSSLDAMPGSKVETKRRDTFVVRAFRMEYLREDERGIAANDSLSISIRNRINNMPGWAKGGQYPPLPMYGTVRRWLRKN